MTEKEISDIKFAKKIEKLQEEKEQLQREFDSLKKDYHALLNDEYKKDCGDIKRLFKVELTFHDDNCGGVYGDVVTSNLLLAKLVELALQKVFADRVSVQTTTKQKLLDSNDNTWDYV